MSGKAAIKIIEQKFIVDPLDILELDIIDFNRLNGCWKNSADALRTIFSWFNQMAVVTIAEVGNFHDAPIRDDWPGWNHCGYHPEIGQKYWNWFYWTAESEDIIYFSDAPDFHGYFRGAMIRGDIGKVSASTFAMSQKGMGAHDLWISLLGDGSRHIIIESLVDIVELYGEMIFGGTVS